MENNDDRSEDIQTEKNYHSIIIEADIDLFKKALVQK